MKKGRKPCYLEKIPNNKLQKMPHTKALNFKPNQDSNLYSSIGGKLGKQM